MELVIPNHLKFERNKLVINKYPKLVKLETTSCALITAKIKNCPNLEYLHLNHNRLKKISGLSKLTKLIRLDVCGNKLESLSGLEKLSLLKYLYCTNNNITELEVKHLKDLIILHCFGNRINKLNCSNLDKLEDLNCSLNFNFKNLKLDGCVNLEILDAAENALEDLTFPYLPKLINLSLRENWNIIDYFFDNYGENKKLILNSPNLEFLDCVKSDIKEVEFIQPCPYSENDEGYNSDLEEENKFKWDKEDYESYDKWDVSDSEYESDEEEKGRDAPTDWEQRAYERQQQREKEDIKNRKGVYEGMLELDFSHKNYTKMNLDGRIYPKSITSINLGNNKLKWLRVANFPNLQRLITSHNKLTEENIIIENCPNLDKENLFYNHKSFDENIEEPTEEKEYNPEEFDDSDIEVNLLTQQIEEIFARNEEDIEFDELQQLLNEIDLSLIDSNYGKKLLALYHKKFQEKFPQLFKKKPQDQENKPDFEKLYNELLEKIEKGKITKEGAKALIRKSSFSGGNSSSDEEKRRTLTKMIDDYYANKEASSPQPTTTFSLWIGLGTVSIILVLIGYFLTMLRNKNKKTIDKKPKNHA